MDGFSYKRGRLYCDGVSVPALAERYGTPLYVYSRSAFLNRWKELKRAFADARPLICYSVKANGNLAVLRALARAGSGFDIVSGGELFRALKAGAKPERIVFAGVGKTSDEMRQALRAGIHMFNVESAAELDALQRAAKRLRTTAQAALRLNPDVDARTNAKTTTARKENKFGIDLHRARAILARRSEYPNVRLRGLHLHLGSPIYSAAPYRAALRKAAVFAREARAEGAELDTLNIGGGYCISYDGRKVIGAQQYAKAIVPAAKALGMKLILEPGRYVIGNAGILVTKVTYVKKGWLDREFVVVDAGMNDLLRPALYDAEHHIWPVEGPPSPVLSLASGRQQRASRLKKVDIVGPICETSDCFARDRRIPRCAEGDLLAVFSAGAYGMTMGSNYNARPRACEVLVSGTRHRVIRRRETYDDLIRGESM